VRAAGGLIWRHAEAGGGIEVVVIHRPSHDDWSFPKGKLAKGETSEDAAVREVEEETGLVCVRRAEIEPARYVDGKGRRKEVRYWLMEAVDARPWAPNDEVDRRVWVPVAQAAGLLTYAHDRALLESFAGAVDRHDPSHELTPSGQPRAHGGLFGQRSRPVHLWFTLGPRARSPRVPTVVITGQRALSGRRRPRRHKCSPRLSAVWRGCRSS